MLEPDQEIPMPTEPAHWERFREHSLELARAFAPRMPRDSMFSHVTAAKIHGLHLPIRLVRDHRVHLVTASRQRRPRIRGTVAHYRPASRLQAITVAGLVATPPVQTWLHCAASLSLDEVIIIGDQLVRRQSPFATMQELEGAVIENAGRHGAKRLRAALEFIRPGTDSPRETMARLAIVRAGLPEPEINGVVRDTAGRYLRRCDLLYPQ